MQYIDINCDMGEGIRNESFIMPFISSANIACGFHAGDETEMKRMVELCLQHTVAVGAHPSFNDKQNFGRNEMDLSASEIHQLIQDQLQILNKIVRAAGSKLHHVKPHGALYNMAAKDIRIATAIAGSVKDFDSSLVYYGLSGSVMIEAALKAGLSTANEVFADRTYQPNGSLTPRWLSGALITNTDEAIQQVLQMIQEKKVTATNGEKIAIEAATICIHGDGTHAVELAKKINHRLVTAGIQIQKI